MMENKETSTQDELQCVVLTLDKEEYGIDIQKVQIIEKVSAITRVPKAPYFIKGVINQRGEIIPVMSLRLKFNLPEIQFTDNARIIIVKLSLQQFSILLRPTNIRTFFVRTSVLSIFLMEMQQLLLVKC